MIVYVDLLVLIIYFVLFDSIIYYWKQRASWLLYNHYKLNIVSHVIRYLEITEQNFVFQTYIWGIFLKIMVYNSNCTNNLVNFVVWMSFISGFSSYYWLYLIIILKFTFNKRFWQWCWKGDCCYTIVIFPIQLSMHTISFFIVIILIQ